jgi:hypothetical protein
LASRIHPFRRSSNFLSAAARPSDFAAFPKETGVPFSHTAPVAAIAHFLPGVLSRSARRGAV